MLVLLVLWIISAALFCYTLVDYDLFPWTVYYAWTWGGIHTAFVLIYALYLIGCLMSIW